jgi:hypothetical protein
LNGAEVGAIGFPTLVEGDMSKPWRGRFHDVKEIAQNGNVHLTLLVCRRLLDVPAKDDMSHLVQGAQLRSNIVRLEQINRDQPYSFQREAGSARKPDDARIGLRSKVQRSPSSNDSIGPGHQHALRFHL